MLIERQLIPMTLRFDNHEFSAQVSNSFFKYILHFLDIYGSCICFGVDGLNGFPEIRWKTTILLSWTLHIWHNGFSAWLNEKNSFFFFRYSTKSIVTGIYGFVYFPAHWRSFDIKSQNVESIETSYVPLVLFFIQSFAFTFAVATPWLLIAELFPLKFVYKCFVYHYLEKFSSRF